MINNSMRFLEFLKLNEDIPVGLKNKELWLYYLRDNFKKPNQLFVTFVLKDKVGINPKTIHRTPIGVYCYPLDYIFDEEDVPFRGESTPTKIKVLKQLSNKVLDKDLGDKEYESKIKLIEKIVKESQNYVPEIESNFQKYIEIWEDKARTKTNFGFLWNITRMISMDYYNKKNHRRTNGPGEENPITWSKLLIEIGYDLVIDNGTGVIHPSEPTQAVFLNPKSYKVVGEEFVDTNAKFKSTNEPIGKLTDRIQKGWTFGLIDDVIEMNKSRLLKISTTDDIDALSYSIRMQKDNPKLFFKLIPYFKKELNDIIDEYINKALIFIKKDTKENEILDYLIKLDIPKVYNSTNLGYGKLIKYIENSNTNFDKNIKKKLIDATNIDDLEKYIK